MDYSWLIPIVDLYVEATLIEDPTMSNPTHNDVFELTRRMEMYGTGANHHRLRNVMSALLFAFEIGQSDGWKEETLIEYSQLKVKVDTILYGLPV